MLLLLPNFQRTLGFLSLPCFWGCKSKHIYFRHQKYLNDYFNYFSRKNSKNNHPFYRTGGKDTN